MDQEQKDRLEYTGKLLKLKDGHDLKGFGRKKELVNLRFKLASKLITLKSAASSKKHNEAVTRLTMRN